MGNMSIEAMFGIASIVVILIITFIILGYNIWSDLLRHKIVQTKVNGSIEEAKEKRRGLESIANNVKVELSSKDLGDFFGGDK